MKMKMMGLKWTELGFKSTNILHLRVNIILWNCIYIYIFKYISSLMKMMGLKWAELVVQVFSS